MRVPFVAHDALHEPVRRISDEAVHADYKTIAAVQERIHALNEAGRPVAGYDLAKAQCWLDSAFHEYSRDDRSDYPQAALAESRSLVAALESGATPARETPLVAGAQRLREDLWRRAASLKDQPGFRCAQRQVACLEVELVHAGHEYSQYGWRHARSYIEMAEDYAGQANAAALACGPPPPAAPELPAPATAPAAPAAPTCPTGPLAAPVAPAERVTLRAAALFAFNRAGLKDISLGGRDELDRLVARLNHAYERVDLLIIYGHTDRLGRPDYNQRLSQARADTVAKYLQSVGVQAPIVPVGRGSTKPVSTCGRLRKRAQLINCLAPDRRVEIDVYGVGRR
jgi:outer membrane protein OmpA-like peptidoglycan-associated protein